MELTKFRNELKKLIPVGSPLWYPQFYVKRMILTFRDPSSVRKVRWHVIHQNILLEDYKAIYFHIPKVACSTIKLICADLLGMEIPIGDIAEEIHLLEFPSVRKYKINKFYRNYFKFAIVRNPWARIVSCYNDKINYDPGHVYERYENTFISYLKKMKVFSEGMSFDRFVEIICDIPDNYAEGHIRSQHRFITDECGNILADFIGRFEQLNQDFNFISEKLNIKSDLPHIRAGKTKNYKDYYSKATAQLIERRYEKDIEMFGYKY
jgi:Sulfotransferase family